VLGTPCLVSAFLLTRVNGKTSIISKPAESTLNSIVCAIDKDIEEHQSQDGPLGDTTYDWPPPGQRAIHNNPLATNINQILYPPNRPAFKSISLQFRNKDLVWDHNKGIAHVQVDDISCPSFIYQCHHSIIEGHKTCQA